MGIGGQYFSRKCVWIQNSPCLILSQMLQFVWCNLLCFSRNLSLAFWITDKDLLIQQSNCLKKCSGTFWPVSKSHNQCKLKGYTETISTPRYQTYSQHSKQSGDFSGGFVIMGRLTSQYSLHFPMVCLTFYILNSTFHMLNSTFYMFNLSLFTWSTRLFIWSTNYFSYG